MSQVGEVLEVVCV